MEKLGADYPGQIYLHRHHADDQLDSLPHLARAVSYLSSDFYPPSPH